MSETKAGKTGTSKTAKAPAKTTSKATVKASAKTAAKSAEKSSAKKPAKPTAQKTEPKENKKPVQSVSPAKKREFWVVFCFLAAILLGMSVFIKEGSLTTAIFSVISGLLGWGAYFLPFVTLADMILILCARGKPVARQIITVTLLPLLCSAAVHILANRSVYTTDGAAMLYRDGIQLVSGGFLAGGFAELMIRILSRVGAGILMFVLLVTDILIMMKVRFIDLADRALDLIEMWRISRTDYSEGEECGEDDEDDEDDGCGERTDADGNDRIADRKPSGIHNTSGVKTSAEVRGESGTHLKDEPKSSLFSRLAGTKENKNSAAALTRGKSTEWTETEESESFDVPLGLEKPEFEDDVHAEPVAKRPTARKALKFTETNPEEMSNDLPLDDDLIHWETTHPQENVPQTPVIYEVEHENPIPKPAEEDDLPPWELPESEKDGLHAEEKLSENPSPAEKSEKKKGTSASDGLTVVDTHAQERPEERSAVPAEKEESINGERPYQFPPVSLLKEAVNVPSEDVTEELRERSKTLADTLASFGVSAQITGVVRGPSVTRYELQLDRGVKLTRLTTLQNDIALALGASGIRIAPIPDKQAVGIEVPNKVVQIVYLREVLLSQNMTNEKSKLAFALGRDITGNSIVANIHKMPHLLIAGTTGSGKSVCINSIIISLLYRTTPRDVRLIMIDPKMVELGNYNGIPHLLIPVVTDYKKAPGTLAWAVAEMERRYKLMAEAGARELSAYNEILAKNGEEPLPKIVIIIDELADLMMVAAKDIEEAICRIAQKARAAGMHLIIATQRPSADVLTGLMKSNIPSRIAFAVASQVESRIILDQTGADKLIGRGDMLFLPIGEGKPLRVQGCYLSDKEIERITDHIKANNQHEYSQEIMDEIENSGKEQGMDAADDEEGDPMLGDAIDIIMECGQASASMLQRRLKLGYARAGRMIDQLEARGIIGPYDGSRPRQILISKMDWQEMKLRYGVRS